MDPVITTGIVLLTFVIGYYAFKWIINTRHNKRKAVKMTIQFTPLREKTT
jgi:hypothetical protein